MQDVLKKALIVAPWLDTILMLRNALNPPLCEDACHHRFSSGVALSPNLPKTRFAVGAVADLQHAHSVIDALRAARSGVVGGLAPRFTGQLARPWGSHDSLLGAHRTCPANLPCFWLHKFGQRLAGIRALAGCITAAGAVDGVPLRTLIGWNGCPRDMRHNSKYHCERGASYFRSRCSIPQMRALPVMPCCAMAVTRYKCTTSLSRRIRPATTNGALGQTAGRRAADAAATLFASLTRVFG